MIRSSRCASALLETKDATEDELKAIDAEVREIVDEAAEFAQHDPEPDPAELWTDVSLTASMGCVCEASVWLKMSFEPVSIRCRPIF